MKKIALFLVGILLFMQSCDILNQIAGELSAGMAPSTEEIVQGLKKALQMGTDYAVSTLHKKDGYFKNPKVKIPLPNDVNNLLQTAMQNKTVKTLGLDKILQQKIDNFVLAINRSAEEAAVEAKPIFIDAIKNLTITQGMNLLQGHDPRGKVSGFDSLAATHYLELKTRSQLFNKFKPKFDKYLNKDVGIGFSANQAWNEMTKYYNGYVAPVLNKPKINYTLSDYATNKALNGLFYMVGQEEKKIRKDPYKWGVDIIKKVFGYVYK